MSTYHLEPTLSRCCVSSPSGEPWNQIMFLSTSARRGGRKKMSKSTSPVTWPISRAKFLFALSIFFARARSSLVWFFGKGQFSLGLLCVSIDCGLECVITAYIPLDFTSPFDRATTLALSWRCHLLHWNELTDNSVFIFALPSLPHRSEWESWR